jgi:signal transduction histidine kinase/CheY-like chemotaxis protein
MKTYVKLRDTGELKEIVIGDNKPVVNSKMKSKWQSMLNTICDISSIPSALIMNVSKDKLSCVVANNNYNHPYKPGDSCHLEAGLYCETVIGTNSYLQINNALKNEKWKDNPDVELSMISYAGLPLLWPDDVIFGTICGLDLVEIKNTNILRKLLKQFKSIVEMDLANLLFFEEYSVLRNENKALTNEVNKIIVKDNSYNESLFNSTCLKRISHSFITPITTIKGLTRFGIKESKDLNIAEYFKKIQKSSDFLLTLFNNIIDFQKLEDNNLTLNYANFNLQETVNQSFNIAQQICKKKEIEFVNELNIKDEFVFADFNRIIQILLNILSNATTYTNKKGKIIAKANLKSSNEKFLFIEFTVTDNGIGMSKEFQEVMYEPFSKENNNELLNNGAGLGLPIVKALVELMHGSIECQSVLNKGTTFKINLSLHKTISKTKPNQNKLIKSCDYDKINILLAEDNNINAKIISKILSSKGMNVSIVCNGLDAYNEVKLNSDKYDIVLMDINMPKMNGYEATAKLREKGFDNVIVALSANSNEEDISQALQVGIDAFLSKPIDTMKLLTTISFFANL